MKTIYKYELNILDYTIISGKIEKFLSVDYQKATEKVCAWAIVDTDLPKDEYIVTCYGTGHRLPDDPGRYIGTLQMYSGELVLHFFSKKSDDIEKEKELIKEYDLEM